MIREMLKVGVIGHGYWGPNLVRNFMATSGSVVTAVCDSREERLKQLGVGLQAPVELPVTDNELRPHSRPSKP